MINYILLFLMITGSLVFTPRVEASNRIDVILKPRLAVDDAKLDTLKADTKDPVCGMPVKKGSTLTVVYKDKVYGFCARSCKASFLKQPEKYVKVKARK